MNVVFPDADLATRSAAEIRRVRMQRAGVAVAAAFFALAFVIPSCDLLLQQPGPGLQDGSHHQAAAGKVDWDNPGIPALDKVSKLDDLRDHVGYLYQGHVSSPEFGYGFPMYQGDKLYGPTKDEYLASLHQGFVEPTRPIARREARSGHRRPVPRRLQQPQDVPPPQRQDPPPGQRRVGEGPAHPALGRLPAALQLRRLRGRPQGQAARARLVLRRPAQEQPGQRRGAQAPADRAACATSSPAWARPRRTTTSSSPSSSTRSTTRAARRHAGQPQVPADHPARTSSPTGPRCSRKVKSVAARGQARASGPRCRGPTPTRATSRCSPRWRAAPRSWSARSGSCPSPARRSRRASASSASSTASGRTTTPSTSPSG